MKSINLSISKVVYLMASLASSAFINKWTLLTVTLEVGSYVIYCAWLLTTIPQIHKPVLVIFLLSQKRKYILHLDVRCKAVVRTRDNHRVISRTCRKGGVVHPRRIVVLLSRCQPLYVVLHCPAKERLLETAFHVVVSIVLPQAFQWFFVASSVRCGDFR